ncbi:FHA domain-containing protein [Herbiconiux sp. VKM Ac-2851]|uniref:FHA domain-containing protein n=1 Tax=Herbiconiux sp. VKM Ac-2851 TaxID=2739025 RepID=UPI001564A562|nr:FHA domain-containing protein [Herbiconiux sp. VKM Ac-2851]NQX34718.1 FHA domain-containing protein [Herbiconiux sp. VKM Ac-2851]
MSFRDAGLLVEQVAETDGPASLGLVLVGLAIAVFAAVAVIVMVKKGKAPEVVTGLGNALANTRVGRFLQLKGEPEVANLAKQAGVEASDQLRQTTLLYSPLSLALPGHLLVVVPHPVWPHFVDSHRLLEGAVVEGARAGFVQARVELKRLDYPKATVADLNRFEKIAGELALTLVTPTIRYTPADSNRVCVFLAETPQTALGIAARELGVGVAEFGSPVATPAEFVQPYEDAAAFDWLLPDTKMEVPTTTFFRPSEVPETRAATGAGAATVPLVMTEARVRASSSTGQEPLIARLLKGESVRIGRSTRNDLVIVDAERSVSAVHAVLTLIDESHISIESLGRTGTWVTNGPLTTRITLGSTEAFGLPAMVVLGNASTCIVEIDRAGSA